MKTEKEWEVYVSHLKMHHRDEKRALVGALINLLEQDVLPALHSAVVANRRTPAKTHVVNNKLSDCIYLLQSKLGELKG
jgi:hypothetical protein